MILVSLQVPQYGQPDQVKPGLDSEIKTVLIRQIDRRHSVCIGGLALTLTMAGTQPEADQVKLFPS